MISILEGASVVLREVRREDVARRAELGNNIEFIKMTGMEVDIQKSFNISDAELWYKRVESHPCKWIIEFDGRMIGTVSLRENSRDNKAKLAIEIYDEKQYGKGLGTEAIELVLAYGFKELKYHKIFLRVLGYNERGINCYKKCGFVIDGYDREGSLINSEYQTDVYMSILSSEYGVR